MIPPLYFHGRNDLAAAARWQTCHNDADDGVMCQWDEATGDKRRGGWSTSTKGGDRGMDYFIVSRFLLSASVPSSRCDGKFTATTMLTALFVKGMELLGRTMRGVVDIDEGRGQGGGIRALLVCFYAPQVSHRCGAMANLPRRRCRDAERPGNGVTMGDRQRERVMSTGRREGGRIVPAQVCF